MRVTWFKMGINVDSDGMHHLKEIPHINGRYCKRNEVESILERINEQVADSSDEINHLINDINELKASSNTENAKKCDTIIKKLSNLQRRTKKCKRPKKTDNLDQDACFT